MEVLRGFTERSGVMVTALELGDLLCLGLIDLLVDARMRMRGLKVDIRPYARLSIGLGPGFTAGRNVDVAVETAPDAIGVLREGSTRGADGIASELGGVGRERFSRAPLAGIWTTSRAIGDRVAQGEVIGACGDIPVCASLEGRLRGLVRSGVEVPADLRLAEVDPRGEGEPSWLGFGPRGSVSRMRHSMRSPPWRPSASASRAWPIEMGRARSAAKSLVPGPRNENLGMGAGRL